MTTRLVRSGRSPVITASDRLVMGDGPDIYATVVRHRWHWHWVIVTDGPDGAVQAYGRTWTRGGAWVKAIAAAHRPDATGAGR